MIESRGTRAQYIRRRRECLGCGYRFSTREMITDALAARPFVERRLTYIEHAIGKLRNDLDLNPHLPRVDK